MIFILSAIVVAHIREHYSTEQKYDIQGEGRKTTLKIYSIRNANDCKMQ